MSRPSLPVVLLLLDVVCSVALAALTSGCNGQTVLDERNGAALVQTGTTPQMVDSDDVPTHTVVLSAADGSETRLPHTRAAALWPTPAGVSRVVVVDHDARLFVQQGPTRRALLDQVVGTPVVLDSQRIVAARQTEPGESDLWILTADGQPPRALAAAPGADDSAFVLDDGRVLFVSGRTGVASLWVVAADPATFRSRHAGFSTALVGGWSGTLDDDDGAMSPATTIRTLKINWQITNQHRPKSTTNEKFIR